MVTRAELAYNGFMLRRAFLFLGVFLAMAACAPAPNSSAPTDPPVATYTAIPEPEQPLSTPTDETATLPTLTSAPTETQTETPNPIAEICDQAEYLGMITLDVPVSNGESVHPNQQFTLTWRLRNAGHCVWTEAYYVLLVAQEGLPELAPIQAFPKAVLPGEEVEITIPIKAPAGAGYYFAAWMLTNANGEFFSIEGLENGRLAHNFKVLALKSGWHFDFIAARCQAQWHSLKVSFLPCQGSSTDWYDGFVLYALAPALEGSTTGNPSVLVVSPDNTDIGYLRGIYPAYTVRSGDVFQAQIGCMDQLPGCRVYFLLRYLDEEGEFHNVQEWFEVFDERPHNVLVDLSRLAGQTVQFVLEVQQADGRRAHSIVFWMNPRIQAGN
jgi:hypothetical protein